MRASRGRKPRIGLSAHLLSLSEDYRGAGINRYIYGLVTHLPAVAPEYDTVAFVAEPRLKAGALSTLDHKTIGLRYMITAILFFCLAGLDGYFMPERAASIVHGRGSAGGGDFRSLRVTPSSVPYSRWIFRSARRRSASGVIAASGVCSRNFW